MLASIPVSHKGGFCARHSLPVLAYKGYTEWVTQKEWHSEQCVIVVACSRHDSCTEIELFPVGVYGR